MSLYDNCIPRKQNFLVLFQKTNVLMGSINSACNPIFYCLFMPSFRRAVTRTFMPCAMKDTFPQESRSSRSMSTLANASISM